MKHESTKTSRLETRRKTDEKILYRIKFSKAAAIPYIFYMIILISIIVGGFILFFKLLDINFNSFLEEPLLFVYLLPLIACVYPLFVCVYKFFRDFIRTLTREGIIYETKLVLFDTWFISDFMFEYKYINIKEVVGTKTLWGKIFNFGEIFIGTGHESGGLPGYKDYEEVLNILNNLVDKENA